MRKTSEAFIHSFSGTWGDDLACVDLRTEDCEHTILPASLGVAKRSKLEFARYYRQLKGVVTESEMTMDDYMANVKERRIVALSSLTAMSPVGPYSNQYVWFLTFTEDGKQISDITEFLDSKSATELLTKLRDSGVLKGH
ncbi:hypothetical protein BAUCODRAFT_70052 [Baudoinia panamericana UAMH 10762]|uniref:SnoaL-like domain-containing protein n=1 Tax=Baudoinia panamericana (strain UAMH 10762) TaxID=717646 RepID=M2NCA5_BAUPA|nr:uncharacterized protein BAUCODRAFT_70052 [Baudoinia panamericana UAMH 10762]EMC96500.1 hypothetical protein BAUCODRAFT_70052 [Baudoinia panamericana UAMH 10762]